MTNLNQDPIVSSAAAAVFQTLLICNRHALMVDVSVSVSSTFSRTHGAYSAVSQRMNWLNRDVAAVVSSTNSASPT